MSTTPDETHRGAAPAAHSAATHDPVCGMRADPLTARATCVHDGAPVGFCCNGCKERFLAEPGRYAHADDPVCGALVERTRPGATIRHADRRYWFCGKTCRERFEAEPARFTGRAVPAPESATANAPVYTCPRHPEVRHGVPADCPRCGMALEPRASAHAPETATANAPVYTCPCHPEVRRDVPADCPRCGMALEPRASAHAPETATANAPVYTCPCHPEVRRDVPADCPRCGMALEPWTPAPAHAGYVCPMHPDVVRDAPQGCPICGMALEPRTAPAGGGPNPELADMRRRLAAACVLTLPVFAIAMSEMVPPLDARNWLGPAWSGWIQAALATPVVLWCGQPFFARGWTSIATRRLNMFTLVAAGAGAAWLASAVALLFPNLLPEAFRAGGAPPLYFEAASVIVTLVILGQVLELRARERTGDAIRRLLTLAPAVARRLDPDGEEREVALDRITPGDRLRIRPGERVPADGAVLDGAASIDESMITGEPMPVGRGTGDRVIGGTVNRAGAFTMRADRVGSDTLVARIAALVAEAGRSRAPIQTVADAVAGRFVPAVGVTAVITFAVWAVFGPAPPLANALVAAVSVLIIACPCALGLATPVSVMAGIGRGARDGVLIRDAESLQRMEKVDTLVLDKTGTLTEGRPALREAITLGRVPEARWLALAADLERSSGHPLAAAIERGARARGLRPAPAGESGSGPESMSESRFESMSESMSESRFESITGRGVRGRIGGVSVLVGNEALLLESGIAIDAADRARAESLRARGETVAWVAVGDGPAGLVAVADPVKPDAAQSLSALRAAGLRVVMLTGDGETTARAVAAGLGIDEVHAGVTPEGKHGVIAALQAQGRIVAMAGDGINDAPALARADVGIAMGTGADIAIESAGITLVKGDLRGIVKARALSRATMRNIRQNLFFAFAYNAIGIPVAAGVLYPVLGVLLSPMLASAAMSASSVSVVTNALRLRKAPL